MEAEEHYCVRWKGFHSNIVTALEDLKTDEEFVDVTLSCDGQTIQGHKVILSACSPYFKQILRDNPCRHPVLILNDMELEVLEALVTYMYHGTVSVPQHRLQSFLRTAEALRIKGIVDTGPEEERGGGGGGGVRAGGGGGGIGAGGGGGGGAGGGGGPGKERGAATAAHPAGDLSLLATAATTARPVTQLEHQAAQGPGVKRRKTAPRKLGSYLGPRGPLSPGQPATDGRVEEEEEEEEEREEEREKENQDLQWRGGNTSENIPPPLPGPGKRSPDSSPDSLDLSLARAGPSPDPAHLALLSSLHRRHPLPGIDSPLNLLHVDGVSAADQMAALLGPEQMAALLGPSWKSRQPRMCQYCQRMFSNKFNLKQHILNMHTVGRELACEICQKKVKNKWYLRRHHVTHHGAPLKK